MSVADLPLDEREALAASLDPEVLAADRARADQAEAQAADHFAADDAEIRDAITAQVEANEIATDDLLLAMGAYIEQRRQYKIVQIVRDAGNALRSRARKAEIEMPPLPGYAERGDRPLNDAYRVCITSEIR